MGDSPKNQNEFTKPFQKVFKIILPLFYENEMRQATYILTYH